MIEFQKSQTNTYYYELGKKERTDQRHVNKLSYSLSRKKFPLTHKPKNTHKKKKNSHL